ncbi:60S ribosomal protein L22 [Candidatus Bathyarchaeota archaeon]|nr:60S ribosomal protein L22 [Candidatus Bathyarchaeota archaeon]
MSSVNVNVSELQSFDGESVKELAAFLKGQLDGTVLAAKKEINLEFEEGKEVKRPYLRLLLRKFLHRANLKEDFRVISGGENSFIVKERKEYSE